MKKVSTISLYLFFLSPVMHAENDENPYDRSLEPAKSFHEGRSLVEAGQFEQAHAIHQKMFSDVDAYRPNVFILYVYNLTYDWHRNAQNYPPAMESLLELRDTLEKRLSERKGHDQEPGIEDQIDLRALFSFNEWLKEDVRSADLFATIEKHYPGLADGMYFHCKKALIRAGQFSTIVKYEPDPKMIVAVNAQVLKTTIKARPDLETTERNRFESAIINSLDAFSSVGKMNEVEVLQKLALEILDSEKIRNHTPTVKPSTE